MFAFGHNPGACRRVVSGCAPPLTQIGAAVFFWLTPTGAVPQPLASWMQDEYERVQLHGSRHTGLGTVLSRRVRSR